MKNVCLINFEDSFVHNIEQLIIESGFNVDVIHYFDANNNDFKNFDILVLGPGPGHVDEYVGHLNFLKGFSNKKILGICLGFQIIGSLFGFKLTQLKSPYHGDSLETPNLGAYFGLQDLKSQFYNSWCFEQQNFNFLDDSMIFDNAMLVYFKKGLFSGVQFHPESIGSNHSQKMMSLLLGGIVHEPSV